MSEYENQDFEAEEPSPAPQQHPAPPLASQEKPHSVRLSIDLRSVRQFSAPATFCAFYDLKLSPQLVFSFRSHSTTVRNLKLTVPVSQGFGQFPFVLTKSDLYFVINEAQLSVQLGQQASDGSCASSIGKAEFSLESVLRADLKKVRETHSQTAHSVARVCDMWLPIKDFSGSKIGEIRIIVYLQDLGEAKETTALPATVTMRSLQPPKENVNPNKQGDQEAEYSAMFELEVWKQAEMEKHKAYLREKESQLRAQIAQEFQAKWMENEKRFQSLVSELASLEGRTKQKSLDLARRQNRILQAEEQLKRRQQEIAQKLVQSEETIVSIKKKFGGERSDFQLEKKNLLRKVKEKEVALEENQIKLTAMRRELEESPVSRLSTELAKKSLEIEKLTHENSELKTSREQMRKQLERAKHEYLGLKRQLENQQARALAAKSAQLDKLQEEMRAMKEANEDRRELERLKQSMMMMQRTQAQAPSNYTPAATQRPTGITGISGHPQQDTSHLGRETPMGYGQSGAGVPQFDRSSLTGQGMIYGSTSNVDDSNVSRRGIEVGGGEVEGLTQEAKRVVKLRNELLATGNYSTQDPIIRELNSKIAGVQ